METMKVLEKYRKMVHHIMIENSMMVIRRITKNMIMTQQETGGMILISKDPKMMTLMDLMITMIQMNST